MVELFEYSQLKFHRMSIQKVKNLTSFLTIASKENQAQPMSLQQNSFLEHHNVYLGIIFLFSVDL